MAAGLGTRLRPLTDELPKPLIPIFQKPLVTFALDHLIGVGVNRFVINTHRHPQLFQDFFAARKYAGFPITLVHEPDLLETGGGIKNAESHFGSKPFLTYSGDILTDVELQPLIDEHFRRGNDVTLALRHTGLAAAVALRDAGPAAASAHRVQCHACAVDRDDRGDGAGHDLGFGRRAKAQSDDLPSRIVEAFASLVARR